MPPKVYTFSLTVGNIIPKSVKCIHSATKYCLSGTRPGDKDQQIAILVLLLAACFLASLPDWI